MTVLSLESTNGYPENSKSGGLMIAALKKYICISTGKSIISNLKNTVLETSTLGRNKARVKSTAVPIKTYKNKGIQRER